MEIRNQTSFVINGEVHSAHSSDSDFSEPLDMLNKYDPVAIVHVTILSRLVESFRFTCGPSILESPVNCESLSQALIDHHRLVMALQGMKSSCLQMPKIFFGSFLRCITGAYVPPLCSEEDTEELIKQKTQEIWSHITTTYGTDMRDITYQDLFDFEFPLFPETTAAERRRLMHLVEDTSIIPDRFRNSETSIIYRIGYRFINYSNL